jgi:phosphoribosylformimino-5-aminoimidazole carboxamide ribotide isomerase
MIVIPALDLLEGKAVRLLQGDPNQKTVFSHDPLAVARKWFRLGAERLHVVDLDGSFAGSPRNRDLVEAIVQGISIPVQLGGGIRDLKTIEAYLEAGVDRVILGTLAAQQPQLTELACRQWPGHMAVAIDARGGRVTVKGWTESTTLEAVDLAKRFEGMGVAVIVYTDVERDGTSRGLNLEATKRLAQSVRIPVIASGGVSSLDDLRALMACDQEGIQGVIVGRALYTGSIDLQEALGLTRGEVR